MTTSVLINSWDNNKIVWKITKHSFDKYWPDCPYPINFITNHEIAPLGKTIKVGKELGFSRNLRNALKQIPDDILIWTLEDYWFDKRVNNVILKKYVSYVEQGKADYIRLSPSDNADKVCEFDNSLHHFNDDCIYKTSMGMSIWRRSLLERLCDSNENIWMFEQNSAKRTLPNEVFLTVINHDCLHIVSHQAMLKNQLAIEGYKYIRDEKIEEYIIR